MKHKSLNAQFEKSIEDYEKYWQAMDKTLYSLPKKYPGHSSRSNINIKLNIIGKTYNSGIAKLIKGTGAFTQLTDPFLSNGKSIDNLLRELCRIKEPLTKEKLSKIVDIHGRFSKRIMRITRKYKGRKEGMHPRSFVSKYMHFHCPAVPLIDSFVPQTLSRILPWEKKFADTFPMPQNVDKEYAWYVMHFFPALQNDQKANEESNRETG